MGYMKDVDGVRLDGISVEARLHGATTAENGDIRPVYLTAKDFDSVTGAPTYDTISGRYKVWTMIDAASPRIASSYLAPTRGKFDIDLLWMNTTTNTGNVVWKGYLLNGASGTSPSSTLAYTGSPVTAEAGPQNELRRTRLASNIEMPTHPFGIFMIDRLGNDASDTLAGGAGIVGVAIIPRPTYDGTLTEDGGWCWFNSPRLIANQAQDKVYGSYVTHDGSLAVSALTVSTGAVSSFTLTTNFEIDDHDVPGLIVLPDGRLAAFYSRHSVTNDPVRYRITTNPGDISAWGAEQTIPITSGQSTCYPKPILVGSRLYVFIRASLLADYYYTDDLTGLTGWTSEQHLFAYQVGWRGYVNIKQSPGRVDFITTDDNPNPGSSYSNLYHCWLDTTAGVMRTSDGTSLGTLASFASTGLALSSLTKIYDHTADGDSWGWDIAIGADGQPRVVFATFPGTNHHYYYARWTGSAWVLTMFANSDRAIIDSGQEVNYAGGLALLQSNPNVVYTSRPIGGVFEIERWTTDDNGATFVSEQVTRRSREKHIRPTTVDTPFSCVPEVFWMAGWYSSFKLWFTRLVWTTST